MKTAYKTEFGDFQTPLPLAREVCELLRRLGFSPDAVIESTCGLGVFLVAASEVFPAAKLTGLEINGAYLDAARNSLEKAGALSRTTLREQDFFTHDWDAEIASVSGDLLILGNPPWVTNSAVAALNGSNVPVKENFQGLRGMEARTGKSNFDISEWMLIRLVRSLCGRPATIAVLCKSATARKFLRYSWQNDGRIAEASIYRIDAKKHFNAAVDACLLLARTGSSGPAEMAVYDSLDSRIPSVHAGLAGQDLVADIKTYRRLQHLEGLCPYQWRSGVKHDCASVMELKTKPDGTLSNKLGEQVSLEPDFLYPLLKCTDLANISPRPAKFVLMTQKRVGEDTSPIATLAPRTWAYLNAHTSHFDSRKSSIYNEQVPFAIFGVGDYSFAPWKVAISGLHQKPRFVPVGPADGRPVQFDDTCYFLSFADEIEALLVADILNSPCCLHFMQSLMFRDAKRPVTVELLQRLNLGSIARDAGLADRWRRNPRVTYSSGEFIPQLELLMETPD